MKTYVILHNIRSAHNVGSIFRTADGAGVSRVYLSGYTPAPVDRFGRIDPSIQKTALGATESVAWEQIESIESVIQKLKSENVRVIAVEQHTRAVEYSTINRTVPTAFIFGNEVEGVSDDICTLAHEIIYIKMHGQKESLNVSVCAGIILFNTHS